MARCAKCSTINRGPGTSTRVCSSCSHPVMFNIAGDFFTDRQLVNAMNRLSNDGVGAYTEQQLFHAVSGKVVVKPGMFSRFSKKQKLPRHMATTFSAEHFASRLTQWRQRNGTVAGRLLDAEALRGDSNRQQGTPLSPELTPHSFDRVVMVDSAETAVMLVANNMHIDHRCVVLSEDGYPEAFRDELVNILRQNPNLTVVALHGVSVAGAGMVKRLETWFPAPTVRLIEVGLRPAQAIKGNLYTERIDERSAPDPAVLADPTLSRYTDEERQWLAWGLHSPLGALSPQRINKVLGGVFANLARYDESAYAEGRGRPGDRNTDDHLHDHDDWDDHRDGDRSSPMIFWFDDAGDNSAGDAGDDGPSKGFAGFDDDFGFDGGDFDGDG